MLQIKVGVQLASLGLPLRKGLLTAREMGAEAVEIDARSELRPRTCRRPACDKCGRCWMI